MAAVHVVDADCEAGLGRVGEPPGPCHLIASLKLRVITLDREARFDDPTRPIRDQGGERTVVTIGEGAWVGAGAIVMADIGKGTVVAAGSVVVKPLPEFVIAAGVPAKVVRSRFDPPAEGAADA